MIFSSKLKKYDPKAWHRCFAWAPIRVDDSRIVWLQMLWYREVAREIDCWILPPLYEYRIEAP